jgi:hypothetical protein
MSDKDTPIEVINNVIEYMSSHIQENGDTDHSALIQEMAKLVQASALDRIADSLERLEKLAYSEVSVGGHPEEHEYG